MKTRTMAVAMLVAAAAVAWAQAEFTAVNGRVEVRAASATEWEPAVVGMRIDANTMISTGFNASAVLTMGASTIQVAQLTRMEFEEIVESPDAVHTSLNLNVGRMSAQVRSVDERRQDFRVRSPIATASVRGTAFNFDGERTSVTEGTVAVYPTPPAGAGAAGAAGGAAGGAAAAARAAAAVAAAVARATAVVVNEGQTSTFTGFGRPTSPRRQFRSDTTVNTNPIGAGGGTVGGDDEGGDAPEPGRPGRSSRGTIRVEIN